MGEIFILEQAAEPIPVRWQNSKGLLSTTVHLTDTRAKTLCGRTGVLALTGKGETVTCVRCRQSEGSQARIRRVYR